MGLAVSRSTLVETVNATLFTRIFFATLSAPLFILSFPPFDWEVLAWIALVPLFMAIHHQRVGRAFAICFVMAIASFMGVFCWINVISGFRVIDFILSGLYLASYVGMFGSAFVFISAHSRMPTILTAPMLWAAMEYIRSHFLFVNLPWALFGHTQYLNLPFIQIASWTGVYGVSFVLVLVNTAIAATLLNIRNGQCASQQIRVGLRPALAALIILVGCLGYGWRMLSFHEEATLEVAIIQPNIAQAVKWDPAYRAENLERHIALTKAAALNGKPTLIIWPEAALPSTLHKDRSLLASMSQLAQETSTYLLVGGASRPKFGPAEFRGSHWMNSAFLISPRGAIEQQHNKMRLLPFAEYLPYRDIVPYPQRLHSTAGYFTPGHEYTIFSIPGARFGVLICWENIFPDLARQFASGGAQFLINITNEAWFGESGAPYQFLSMSVFRAVENRMAIARSANTGISAFIDPHGRVKGRVQDGHKDVFVSGYLRGGLSLSREPTFYTIHGDVFAYATLLGSLSTLIIAACLRTRLVRARKSLEYGNVHISFHP
jgi:apolipoprotein N-acyltransferase